MEKYSHLKYQSDALSQDANIAFPSMNADHFFLSFLMDPWRKPWLKLIFSIQIESTAPIQIVLSCLILENVCQLGQVHQVSLIIHVLSALFVKGLSVWNVAFLGILP